MKTNVSITVKLRREKNIDKSAVEITVFHELMLCVLGIDVSNMIAIWLRFRTDFGVRLCILGKQLTF